MSHVTRKALIVLVIAAHLILISNCDKNPEEPEKKEPPTLPPASSMTVDFSTFTTGGGLAKSTRSQQHFATAAVTVLLVNAWVGVGLSVPVFLFAQAINTTPVLETDGKFHWRYTSKFALVQYSTDLVGWIDTEAKVSRWEMYVSAGKQLNHFKYYDGYAALDLQSGQWIFYREAAPDSGRPMIQLDWQISSDTVRTLTFTNVLKGNSGQGDVLAYNVNGRELSMAYTDASENTTATIYWDAITTAGCIEAPNYNDGQPGCWDEKHDDIAP